ncbi:hypothetical protein EYC80_001889 [Monilinia laxa]|uniref:Uncharacterized protein n=1 Tax=Monilinia laxa TaxID=61186 RepID=A0A5N6K6D5_MONLA|nr:hypothetical protein EYC80_001889 [Monilinia laxa]
MQNAYAHRYLMRGKMGKAKVLIYGQLVRWVLFDCLYCITTFATLKPPLQHNHHPNLQPQTSLPPKRKKKDVHPPHPPPPPNHTHPQAPGPPNPPNPPLQL